MKVRYTGSGAGRHIRLSDGREVYAPTGQAVEVPDADGKNLVQQAVWKESKRSESKSESESASAEKDKE